MSTLFAYKYNVIYSTNVLRVYQYILYIHIEIYYCAGQ
jgi:hypothetical protein